MGIFRCCSSPVEKISISSHFCLSIWHKTMNFTTFHYIIVSREDDVRLLILILASSFIIISMMVVIGVVSCILLCFEDTLHDEEELVEHILQVNLVKFYLDNNTSAAAEEHPANGETRCPITKGFFSPKPSFHQLPSPEKQFLQKSSKSHRLLRKSW